ncbi:MAG TPA: fused MFS/spermidine synthase [Bryobacteraceae bacterium]|nr:fused MFS/spermidine synthase [Bryobacteraceae bacterium]
MSSAPTATSQLAAGAPAEKSSLLPVLLVLFAASGCSALIYEVVWYQLLQLAIGSTSVSLGILLATFMGGLCIGSLWLPRRRFSWHPLRVYAALEAGIAVCAVIVQFSLPYLNRVYVVGAEHGFPGMLLRGLLAAVCMIAPTILMGASLPAIARWIESTPNGVAWWGFLYGGNTAGAVFGCLLAGFYLLRVFNMATATYVAVAINLTVAAASYLLAPVAPAANPVAPPAAAKESESHWPVYLAIGLSGATALGAEVVWTRLLGMLLLATVYVFSIILAVFLTGLAIGSWAGSALLKRIRAQEALGWCQILVGLGMAWTAWSIVHALPYWVDDVLTTHDSWRMYQLDLKRCLWAILPSTLFWGASFPLACAAIARPGEDSGRVTGSVYAANTLGGIAGALIVSLALIPWVGSQQTERILLVVAVLSGLVALVPVLRKSPGSVIGLTACLVLAGVLTWGIDPIPGELIAYGRQMGLNMGSSKILYTKEGRNSSVAISQWNNGAIYVNVNGHVEATTEIYDMKLQRMVGHLPALLHPNPKSVLGIGFGAGVSAGTFTRYPGIQKITVCEIEPVIPPASTRFFGDQDYRVALNPKTHIVFDDARHYLMTTTEKFDIIASDPLDVFVKGTAALYSREYFESVKRHLNAGGMFTLYVPLYETDEPTIQSELKTFFDAFPYGSVWANLREGEGYDMVFMGQLEPLRINLDEVQRRYDLPEHEPVRQSLRDIGVGSLFDLFSTYTGSAADLAPYVEGAAVNTDQDLRLSYLAGWGINSHLEDHLYRQMLKYRHTPEDTFLGSPDKVHPLLAVLPAGR